MIQSPEIRINYNAMLWLINNLQDIQGCLDTIHERRLRWSVDDWMNSPNPDFNYQTPEVLLYDGDFDTLDKMKMLLEDKFNEACIDESE